MKKAIFGVILLGLFLSFGCLTQECPELNCNDCETDCSQCTCPEVQPSPFPFCLDENTASVAGDSEGNFMVTTKLLGGGSTIYLTNGSTIECHVVNPEYLDDMCFSNQWAFTVCENEDPLENTNQTE